MHRSAGGRQIGAGGRRSASSRSTQAIDLHLVTKVVVRHGGGW